MNLNFVLFTFVVLAGAPSSTHALDDAERRAIYGTGEPLDDYVNFDAYGAGLKIANAERPYDQNQNHIGKVAPTFVNGTTITATGNTWSAYLLPVEVDIREDSVLQFSFMLEEDTVDGFQAVCLDQDTEMTGNNGKCFVLRSSQGWIKSMINVAEQTAIGEISHHSIPVGNFFTGPANYIAFIQDSDGQDRSTGSSSIFDLQLISLEEDMLQIEIDGTVEYLKNDQVSVTLDGGDQDEGDYWMTLSEDSTAVQINGNQWKALPLNSPYNITHSTVLEFDLVVAQSVDFDAVCLDWDNDVNAGEECVVLQNSQAISRSYHHLTSKLETGVSKRLVVPFGSFMGLGEGDFKTVRYIAFAQDNDESARHNGRSTWSNFRLYDQTREDVEISVYGTGVAIANTQGVLNYEKGKDDDSRDHIMSVSADGRTVTASGNSWKSMALPESFVVGKSTVLKFTFTLFEEEEMHAICLLDGIFVRDSRNNCFYTAGTQSIDSRMGQKIEPYTVEGQEKTYEILAGSYFTGEVKYLGFILDNDIASADVDRIKGQASWSNIEIYNLPTLDIGFDGEIISVENSQMSYKSASEDTTPIRDYMASVSKDGSSINMVGNMWRALQLPSPLLPAKLGDFVVSFDFTLDEAAEFHAICFEENLKPGNYDDPEDANPRRCVSTAFFQQRSDTLDFLLSEFQTRVGESHRYILNLSKMFDRLYVDEAYDGTPYPTPTPVNNTLVWMGNDGIPAEAFPLQACQSDCDSDDECAGSLKCFERSRFQVVPGCIGMGKLASDYCYDAYGKDITYIAFISDNDVDKTVGNSTYGNIAITTSLSSCLKGEDFDFQLSDCTVGNFLEKVQDAMENEEACTSADPLLELFAIFDATQETDVYKQIEKICTSAYKLDLYDFADDTLATDEALERQLVKEYIDGGTVMNYEVEADTTVKIRKVADKFSSSRLLSMPKHHALDNCEIGAAMCCSVASRTGATPAVNSNVCYVDMKASKRTAHVTDGWSIYGDSSVYCEGFAWGKDGGSLSSALKGNALFKVGFLDNVDGGRVEQVPGAPLCGCMDRMPVVSEAACTEVTSTKSLVDVSFDGTAGMFDASFTIGDIEYGDCDGRNLVEHFETLVGEGKASPADVAYMQKRIVGEDGCGDAINGFLSNKGLVRS